MRPQKRWDDSRIGLCLQGLAAARAGSVSHTALNASTEEQIDQLSRSDKKLYYAAVNKLTSCIMSTQELNNKDIRHLKISDEKILGI